jgi:hypothetical protein
MPGRFLPIISHPPETFGKWRSPRDGPVFLAVAAENYHLATQNNPSATQ